MKKKWTLIIAKGVPPHERSGCKAVIVNINNQKDIYFFGGYTFRKGDYFKDLFRFELKNNTWY